MLLLQCYHDIPDQKHHRDRFLKVSESVRNEEIKSTEQPGDVRRSSVWRKAWITPASIVGFYLLALLCALAHFCIFYYLDDRIADQGNEGHEDIPFRSTTIPQSYVTTISLLLVTSFRAALIASIGVSYTQHLWQTLRLQLLEVGLIEELFQIRANALRLLNPLLIQQTPLLLLIALISWLVPIATIYPPGAMTVSLETRFIEKQLNISVIPQKGRMGSRIYSNRTCLRSLTSFGRTDVMMFLPEGHDPPCQIIYFGPSKQVTSMTESMLIGRLTDLPNPFEGNGSYVMTFPGPRMQCNQTMFTNITIYNSSELFSTMQMWIDFRRRILLDDAQNEDWVHYFPCPQRNSAQPGNPAWSGGFEWTKELFVIRDFTRTDCAPATAQYTVSVGFDNGRQTVRTEVDDVQPLRVEWLSQVTHMSDTGENNILSRIYTGPLEDWEYFINALALIDSLSSTLQRAGEHRELFISPNESPKPYRLPNGTTVEVCTPPFGIGKQVTGSSSKDEIFRLSPFNAAPFTIQNPRGPFYNLSEEVLNEALTNMTIKALFLNLWHDTVNATDSRVYKIFRFQRHLNFFLPYGLCLLCTLPVVVMGMMALRYNGVSAIDGGFLQILMTAATGQTQVEIVAAQGSLGGYENVPEALKKLKVRFGELLTDESLKDHVRTSESRSVVTDREACDAGTDGAVILSERDCGNNVESQSVRSADQGGAASTIEGHAMEKNMLRRAGFGVLDETIVLRRGAHFSSSVAESERESYSPAKKHR